MALFPRIIGAYGEKCVQLQQALSLAVDYVDPHKLCL